MLSTPAKIGWDVVTVLTAPYHRHQLSHREQLPSPQTVLQPNSDWQAGVLGTLPPDTGGNAPACPRSLLPSRCRSSSGLQLRLFFFLKPTWFLVTVHRLRQAHAKGSKYCKSSRPCWLRAVVR